MIFSKKSHLKNIIHFSSSLYYQNSLRKFLKNAKDMKFIQLNKLRAYEKGYGLSSYFTKESKKAVWHTDYSDYSKSFEKLRRKKSFLWLPTSGSTYERKWIPYPKEFITEINKAFDVFLGDIYKENPSVREGVHYWSLSWLPNELRGQFSNDDSLLLMPWKRKFFKITCPTPKMIELAPTSKEAWRHLLVYLIKTKNLSLVSIWSPTYWLEVCQSIVKQWGSLSYLRPDLLVNKSFHADFLDFHKPSLLHKEFFKQLWPQLSIISSWESGPSKNFSDQIKKLFPHVKIHGKGLWATEGVVTLPVNGRKVLAYNSHFFEFLCLSTGRILKAWELEPGQRVSPLLWTASGLKRYLLKDHLLVTEIWNHLPCFDFEGRLHTVDLVGEKVDNSLALKVFKKVQSYLTRENLKATPISLIGNSQTRRYELILIGSKESAHLQKLKESIDEELSKSHHYKLARSLNQLSKPEVFFVSSHSEFTTRYPNQKIKGQFKAQTLFTI